jgi:hypothetical protein
MLNITTSDATVNCGSSVGQRSTSSAPTRGSATPPVGRAVRPRARRRVVAIQVAATLLLSFGCGASDEGAATTSSHGLAASVLTAAHPREHDRSTGILKGIRFAVPPVLLFTSVQGKGGGYTVYARLTRELPRDRNGGIAASFNIMSDPDAVQGNPMSTRRGRRRHCYQQAISQLSTQPTPTYSGARVRLLLAAHDREHHRGTLTTTVRLKTREVRGNVSEGSYPKRVGC